MTLQSDQRPVSGARQRPGAGGAITEPSGIQARAPQNATEVPGGRTAARRAGGQFAAVLLSVSAGLPLLRVFGSPGLRILLLSAVPAGVVAGLLLCTLPVRAGRRSPWAVAVTMVAALAAGTVPGMILAAADPYEPAGLPSRFVDAATNGWRVLISVPLPVPDTRSFADLPILLLAVLAVAVAVIAAGPRPGGALIPAAAVFGLLLVFGVHGPGRGYLFTGTFVLAALVYLAATATVRVPRTYAVAPASAFVILLVAVSVWFAAPGTAPFDPRASLVPPVNTATYVDPLAQLSFQTAHPQVPVFTATVSGALVSHPRNWVVLAYDDYDGAGWTSATSARPDAVSPAAPGTVGSGSVRIRLADGTELLPHPSYVTSTTPDTLDYDTAHEMLLSQQVLLGYRLGVSVSEPSASALSSAAVPLNASLDLTAVPTCVPAKLRTLASQAAQSAALPDEQAVALERALQAAPYTYDQAAPPGESCGSVDRMLTGGRGTSAQFATAFALAARILGLPSRVVSGYLPGKTAAGTVTVTDGDAFCWPQVLLTGVGWVDFDPTPQTGAAAAGPPREQQAGLSQISQNLGGGKPTAPITKVFPPTKVAPGRGPAVWIAAAVAGAFGVFVLWLVAVRARLGLLRRRRRRADRARERILGAWDEVLDPLRLSGVSLTGSTAPTAAAATAGFAPEAGPPAGQLAVLVERALYDEVGEDDAVSAWDLSDQARRVVLSSLGRRARLRRILWGRSTPPPGRDG